MFTLRHPGTRGRRSRFFLC